MKTYAVLTGDLIGSRELTPARLEQSTGLLRDLAGEFAAVHDGLKVGQPDVFRGDSWQWYLPRPALAFTAAVFLRAGLKSHDVDSRIGIGIGSVTLLHEERISQSTGPAFVASGEALDGLEKDRTLGFRVAANKVPSWAVALQDGVAPLLDLHLCQWSQRESLAVYGTLRKLTQQAIAELPLALTREGKAPTRQAVQDSLHRIQWSSHVEPVLSQMEKLLGTELGA